MLVIPPTNIFANRNELQKLLHNSYYKRRALRARAKTSLMATSKSFFGIRRGSTKSMTYSVYRGQQVTKDRVTSVANPQSSSQMDQRLRLVLVANAATKLKGLINHSFEGVTYGETSVSKFRALNLVSNGITPLSWVPKGAGDCGVADFIVSKGSLGTIDCLFVDKEPKTSAIAYLGKVVASDFKSVATDLAAWMQKNNLEKGDQLTFLVGFRNGTTYPVGEDNELDGNYHSFAVNRFVLNLDDDGLPILSGDNEGWKVVSNADGWTLVGPLVSLEIAGVDETLTTNIEFTAEKYTSRSGYAYEMCGVILSRLDGSTWRRSNCRLAAKATSGSISYDLAHPTYVKAKAASSKYLNQGSDTTGIITG